MEDNKYINTLAEKYRQRFLSTWEEDAKEKLDLSERYRKDWQQNVACIDFFREEKEGGLFLNAEGVQIIEATGIFLPFRSPKVEKILDEFEMVYNPKSYSEVQSFSLKWMESKAEEAYEPFRTIKEYCEDKDLDYVEILKAGAILLRDNYLVRLKFGKEERG